MRLLFVGVLLILGYWMLMFAVQRSMLFPAPPPPADARPPADAVVIHLKSGEESVEAWHLPPLSADDRAPLLIFAHGNAELIDHWPAEFREVREWGIGVLLVEYPGYGRTPGVPTRESIGRALRAAHDWAVANPAVDPGRLIYHGRSLGGGVVADLALERPPSVLVLESTFTSVRALASRYLAPSVLVRDRFDPLAAVRRYRGPTVISHGTHDEVIPFSHGRALAEAAGVRLVALQCGHNDCPRPWPALAVVLRTHGILR